jgi:hypothetical protein
LVYMTYPKKIEGRGQWSSHFFFTFGIKYRNVNMTACHIDIYCPLSGLSDKYQLFDLWFEQGDVF